MWKGVGIIGDLKGKMGASGEIGMWVQKECGEMDEGDTSEIINEDGNNELDMKRSVE